MGCKKRKFFTAHFRLTERLFVVTFVWFMASRVRAFVVGQSRKIIHAGVQSQSDFNALVKGEIPFSILE